MQLEHDTQAVLLLTAYFGDGDGTQHKPLAPKEWGTFATWLNARGGRPGQLLDQAHGDLLDDWVDEKITRERIDALLRRGSALAMACEKWERAGLWIMTRADKDYPTRLKRRLRELAPPVLFGCGNRELLDRGGIAVVGSRNVTDEGRKFAADLGRQTALSGRLIISGGARGVDEAAMLGALENDGQAIGILANDLIRQASSGTYRKYLRRRDLVLVSPFKPDGRFQVGNAMARNKYIYCTADAAVVVACEEGKGGTWSGATEALRRDWVPVWVLGDPDPTSGNAILAAKGAHRLDPADYRIDSLETSPSGALDAPDDEPSKDRVGLDPAGAYPAGVEGSSAVEHKDHRPASESPPLQSGQSIFEAFLSELEPVLRAQAESPKTIAEKFGLELTQTKKWLERAEELGRITVEKKRPLTYRWNDGQGNQGALFKPDDHR